MKSSSGAKIFNGQFILLTLISFCVSLGVQALNSTMSLYVDFAGGTTSFSGKIAMYFAVTAAVARIVSGNLADKFGRKMIILVGALIFAVSAASPAIVPGLGMLIVFRIFQGIGYSATSTAAGTAAADVLPKERLGEGLGYYGLSQSLAMAVGPTVGMLIIGNDKYNMLFLVIGAFGTVMTLLACFCNYEKGRAIDNDGILVEEKKENIIYRLFEKRALPAACLIMLICTANASYITFATYFAKSKGFDNPGLFFTAAAAGMILARILTSWIMDRLPMLAIFLPAAFLEAASFAISAYTESKIVFYWCGALYGIGLAIFLPLLNAMAIKNTPSKRWGAANATFYMGQDLGVSFGSAIWGSVLDISNDNFQLMFLLSMACIIVTALAGIIILKTGTCKK